MSFKYINSDKSFEFQCNLECRQCNAISERTGEQCKRITCMQLPYCNQHTKIILGLVVKHSTIPEAGKGLFTLRPIKKDAKIAEYTGRVLTKSQIDSLYGHDESDLAPYSFKLSRDLYLDSACSRSIAAFANDSPSHNNAKLSINHVNNKVFLRATQDIAANEEIFTSYGAKYFMHNNDLPQPIFSTSSRKLNKSQSESEVPLPIYKPEKPKQSKNLHSWDYTHLEVKPSNIPKAGNGLFAKKQIQKGDIITCIDHPLQLEDPEEDAEFAGYPHDSVVYFKPSPKSPEIGIFDKSWKNPNDRPLWYYMNHGQKESNAELIHTMTQFGPSVCWKAKRRIDKGEEILFNYNVGGTTKF